MFVLSMIAGGALIVAGIKIIILALIDDSNRANKNN